MQSSDELSSNSSSVDLSEGSSEEAVSPEINGELIATHTGGCSPSSMLWLTIMFSGISGLLWGYDIGVITGALVFLDNAYEMTEIEKELIVSLAFLGAIFGSLISGPLNSVFGRKRLVIFGNVLFIGGAFMMAFSPAGTMVFIMLGRVVVGLAMGMASLTVPLYIAELSPAEKRGMLISMNEVLIVFGILLSFLVNSVLSFEFYGWDVPTNTTSPVSKETPTERTWDSSQNAWRWSFGISAIPAFVQFFGIMFLPESPRWLIYKGRVEEGLQVLQKTRSSFQEAEEEKTRILQSISNTMNHDSTWSYIQFLARDLIFGASRGPLLLSTAIAFIVQFTGQPTVLYYTSTFIKESGMFPGTTQNLLISIVPIIVKLIVTLIATFAIIEQQGRKLPLMGGLGAMAVALIILAIAVAIPSTPGWVVMGGLSIYMAAFALSLGPICWILYSELFPSHSRDIGMALATAIHFGWNMLVSLFFLSFYTFSPPGTFVFYAIVALIGIVFIYIFIPETKGLNLEDIGVTKDTSETKEQSPMLESDEELN